MFTPKDEGAEVVHRPVGKFIVDVTDGSAIFTMHRAEGPRVKEPLKDFGSILAERVAQALLDPSAGNRPTKYQNPRHELLTSVFFPPEFL